MTKIKSISKGLMRFNEIMFIKKNSISISTKVQKALTIMIFFILFSRDLSSNVFILPQIYFTLLKINISRTTFDCFSNSKIEI